MALTKTERKPHKVTCLSIKTESLYFKASADLRSQRQCVKGRTPKTVKRLIKEIH